MMILSPSGGTIYDPGKANFNLLKKHHILDMKILVLSRIDFIPETSFIITMLLANFK